MATSSHKLAGLDCVHGLAPQVGVATILALLSFLSVYRFGIVAVIVGVLALAFFCVAVANPDFATLAVVFVMYSNAAAVAVHSHPALAPLAVGFFLLLFFPTINFVVLRREGIRIDGVLWLMLVYLVILVVSALFSRYPAGSIKPIIRFVFEGMTLYFLLINSVRSPKVLRKVIWVLLLVAGTLGTLSWYQDLTKSYRNDYLGFAATKVLQKSLGTTTSTALAGSDEIDLGAESRGLVGKHVRALGPVNDPNFYSQMLVAVLPLALVLAFSHLSRRVRVMAAAACAPIMAGIVLSFSRGAALAVIVVGICLFFLRYIRLRYALLFAAVLAVVIASTPGYFNRINTLSGLSSQGMAAADFSLRERSSILHTGLQVFLQHPLLGVGLGQASEYIEVRGVGFSAGVRGLAPHNTYLEQLIENGILGFTCFMAMAFVTLRNLFRASRYWIGRRPEYAHMAMGLMLAVVAFLTTSLFLHLAFPRYYWLLMGLAGAAALMFSPDVLEQHSPEASLGLAAADRCSQPTQRSAESLY